MNSSGRRAKGLDVKAGWDIRRWLPKEGAPERASGYVRWRGTGARVMGRAFRLVALFRPLRLPATWFADSRSPRPASRRAAGRSCAQYGRRKALVTAALLRSVTPATSGSDRQEMAETLETDAAAALLRLAKKNGPHRCRPSIQLVARPATGPGYASADAGRLRRRLPVRDGTLSVDACSAADAEPRLTHNARDPAVAHYARFFSTASRRSALTRVCHPRPVARSAATTSGSSRSDTI